MIELAEVDEEGRVYADAVSVSGVEPLLAALELCGVDNARWVPLLMRSSAGGWVV